MDPLKSLSAAISRACPLAVHVLWVRNMPANLTFKTVPSVLHQTLYLNFALCPLWFALEGVARTMSLLFGAFISFFALAALLRRPNVTFPLSYQIPFFTTTHSKRMFILKANLLMFRSVPTHFSPFYSFFKHLAVCYTHT